MSIQQNYYKYILRYLFVASYFVLAISCSRKTNFESDFEKYLIKNSDLKSDVRLFFKQKNDTCKTKFCFNKIKIQGSLVNHSDDTIRFLTYTCQGEEFLFECDTAQYLISPDLWCQIIFPRIKKIAPRDSVQINSTLLPKDSTFKIVENIGFKLMKVENDSVSTNSVMDNSDVDSLISTGAIEVALLKGERF